MLKALVVQGLLRSPETGETFALADHLRDVEETASGGSSTRRTTTASSDEGAAEETEGATASSGETAAEKESDQGDQVAEDKVSDQVLLRLNARQRTIVAACDVPRSLAELMERAGVSHRTHFRNKHLKPLLAAGVVRMTNPDNPRASNQKYVLTEAGAALRARWAKP